MSGFIGRCFASLVLRGVVLMAILFVWNAHAIEPRVVSELKGGVKPYTSSFPRGIYWMDNTRLIFVGAEDQTAATRREDKVRVRRPGLYIWDTTNNSLKRHADVSGSGSFCYADGYVRYVLGRSDKTVLRTGKLGIEKETVFDGPLPSNPGVSFSRLTCKEYRQSDYPKIGRGGVFPLRDGDGYLGLTEPPQNHQHKLGYFRTATSDGIPLPFSRFTNERYLPYFKAYLFQPTDASRKVFLLSLDGSTRVLDIPNGLWMAGTTAYDLTRSGVLMVSHSSATETPRVFRDENRGAFLINGSDVRRIASGRISGFQVSPDGCKVAMAIGLVRPQRRGTLQVLDVCSEIK